MNNILHLKYAVEVEKTGSISKAANNLYMGQPQLSKAIRELEDSLGITVFNRTSKGVVPTKKGAEFLIYAKNILAQIEEMESIYKPREKESQKFDIAVPRASYISFAFTEFVKAHNLNKAHNINYRETNSVRAIKNVADSVNNIAIVRYQNIYEKYFLGYLEERELKYEPILEFEYRVLMSSKHPLANEEIIKYSSLCSYTEIIHGDTSVPALPVSKARELIEANENKKIIAVYERGSQYELLSRIPTTYMWASPVPKDVISCFGLVQKLCDLSKNKYKDILIYRSGYKFTDEDKLFMKKIEATVAAVLNGNI